MNRVTEASAGTGQSIHADRKPSSQVEKQDEKIVQVTKDILGRIITIVVSRPAEVSLKKVLKSEDCENPLRNPQISQITIGRRGIQISYDSRKKSHGFFKIGNACPYSVCRQGKSDPIDTQGDRPFIGIEDVVVKLEPSIISSSEEEKSNEESKSQEPSTRQSREEDKDRILEAVFSKLGEKVIPLLEKLVSGINEIAINTKPENRELPQEGSSSTLGEASEELADNTLDEELIRRFDDTDLSYEEKVMLFLQAKKLHASGKSVREGFNFQPTRGERNSSNIGYLPFLINRQSKSLSPDEQRVRNLRTFQHIERINRATHDPLVAGDYSGSSLDDESICSSEEEPPEKEPTPLCGALGAPSSSTDFKQRDTSKTSQPQRNRQTPIASRSALSKIRGAHKRSQSTFGRTVRFSNTDSKRPDPPQKSKSLRQVPTRERAKTPVPRNPSASTLQKSQKPKSEQGSHRRTQSISGRGSRLPPAATRSNSVSSTKPGKQKVTRSARFAGRPRQQSIPSQKQK